MNMSDYAIFWYLLGGNVTWHYTQKQGLGTSEEVCFIKFDLHPPFYRGAPAPRSK